MVRFKHLMVIMVAIIRTMDVKSNGHIWLSWQRLVLQIQGYIYIGKKLSREHLVLTSYSRMTFLLAVQVANIAS